MFRSSGNPLRRAGASVSEIALSRFINHTVFETKLGDLGMLLSLVGIDPDCRTDEMLNAFTRRFESAIRLFDDRFRVYSYIVKRSGAAPPSQENYSSRAAEEVVHRRVDALRARAHSLYEIRLYLGCCTKACGPTKNSLLPQTWLQSTWPPRHGSRTHGTSVAHKRSSLAVPLRIDPIDRVFQHRGWAVVVFRRDEYKTIRGSDLSRPLLHHLMFVRRPARHGRGRRLIEEGHREVAEAEEPSFNSVSLSKLLENPLSWLFREPTLACAADDYGNCHIVLSLCDN
jgi:hypothetical protein